MTALVLNIILFFGLLLMAFLGHLAACGLKNMALKSKKDRRSIGEAWKDRDASREKLKSERLGQ